VFDSVMGAEVVEILSLPLLLLRLGTKWKPNETLAMMATKINPILSWRVSEVEFDD